MSLAANSVSILFSTLLLLLLLLLLSEFVESDTLAGLNLIFSNVQSSFFQAMVTETQAGVSWRG